MTAVAVCLVIGIINLILWAVLFMHFKSRYSAERILADIEEELNKIIRDINNETARCVTIVTDCRQSLVKLVDEAKKYTDLSHESLEKKAKSAQVMSALNGEAPPPKRRRTSYADLAPGPGGIARSPIQRSLFDRSPVDDLVDASETEDLTEFSLDLTGGLLERSPSKENESEEGTADASAGRDFFGGADVKLPEITVPEINISEIKLPKITKAQKQVLVEKSLRTKVLELNAEGFSPEAIAARLDISLSEVQLIVNLYGL